MTRYISVVLSNAVPGHEDEFNAWYTNQHIPDVLAIPGILAATRYRRMGDDAAPPFGRFRYMVVYELETDDLRALFRELNAAVGTARMPMHDALAPELAFYDWEVLPPRQVRTNDKEP